jgi:hypothetical protein
MAAPNLRNVSGPLVSNTAREANEFGVKGGALSPLQTVDRLPTDDPFDLSHPIASGATVTIFRMPTMRPPYIEGRAVIKAVARRRDFYWVEFPGDPALKQRAVFYNYQNDPGRFLEMLTALWRASNAPDVDEFFPPDKND